MQSDPARLEAYLKRWEGQTLDYRKTDCVRFAAGWAAQHGIEALKSWPGWASEEGALNAMRCRGKNRLADAVTAHLGLSFNGIHAEWGDIVGLDNPPLDGLGIAIEGRKALFLDGQGGFARVNLRNCAFAWRVPGPCPL